MADIFLPKWEHGNRSQFMKNLDRHLRYEVDLEKYEAKKREIECGKENQHGGQIEGLGQLKEQYQRVNTFAGINTSRDVGVIRAS